MLTFRPDRVAVLRATSVSARHLTDSAPDIRQGDLVRLCHLAEPEGEGLEHRFAPLFQARREDASAA